MDLNNRTIGLNLRPTSEPAIGSETEFRMDVGARSDAGRVRENNEDSFLAARELSLFVLSDGMGGLASGEVASRLTVDTVLEHCRETGRGAETPSHRLASGVQAANRTVYHAARHAASKGNMGATVVAVQCNDDRMSVAHVGDSRVYRLRNDRLQQLTQDHSFVAEQARLQQMTEDEAASSGLQHVLTRAVGIAPEVEVDTSEELVLDGDIVLLCSDGLTRELSDKQIASVLGSANDAQEAADQLVRFANDAGGADNVTVIVIRQLGKMPSAFGSFRRLGRWLGGRKN